MNCTESELLNSNELHNYGYVDCPGTNKKKIVYIFQS